MKTFFRFLVVTIACGSLSMGQGRTYDIVNIPTGLKGSASAVVRISIERFDVENSNSATYTMRRAITIFDKDDRDYGAIQVWYDRSTTIEELEGRIYDANGEEIRELEESDIKDYAAFDDNTLYTDTRVRLASLYHHRYPYTVEFTYELSYDGFLNWPSWYSRLTHDPVQESRFEVTFPGELRFWCNKDSLQPVVVTKGKIRTYRWEAHDLPYLGNDVGGDIEDISEIVRIAPASFSLEGHAGNMRTWAEFGEWYAGLNKGRNNLPEAAIAEIRGLVKPTDDIKTKAETLYRYLQARTRYVSVQLGIGGWQPYDARYVHERRYGDCKALTNYMMALLEVSGVRGYPVLINNGNARLPMIEEFPSQQFNHVILCIPNGRDSLWLECTSQTIPFGHIGWSNEGRSALLISPDSGIIVKTPRSAANQNTQRRTGMVALSGNGDAHAEILTTVTGNQQDRLRGGLETINVEERRRWILKDLQIPHVNLNSFSINGLESKESTLSLSVQLTIPRLATLSGSRQFLRPNLTERVTSPPSNFATRLSPVRFAYAYHDVDSIYYRIPLGFSVESLPASVSFAESFGSFKASTESLSDTAVIYRRELIILHPVIPASEYQVYRSFFSSIFRSDRAQAVLVRKPFR